MDDSDEESSPVKAHKKNNQESPKKRNKSFDSSSGKQAAIQEQRRLLPIAQGMSRTHAGNSGPHSCVVGKDALINEIRDNDVTVLIGETGSGKTTRTFS